jgi:hypothetical protein
LFDSADFVVGQRNHAGLDALGFQACGGVGEDKAALLGGTEQRPQRDDRVATLVPAQWL